MIKRLAAAATTALSLVAGASVAEEVTRNVEPVANPSMHCTDDGYGKFSIYHKSLNEKPAVIVSAKINPFENIASREMSRAMEVTFKPRDGSGYLKSSYGEHFIVADEFSPLTDIFEGTVRKFQIDYTNAECSITEDIGDGIIREHITMPMLGGHLPTLSDILNSNIAPFSGNSEKDQTIEDKFYETLDRINTPIPN